MATFIQTLQKGEDQILPRSVATAVLMENSDTVEEAINKKANATDVYTKTEADAKYLTEHQDLDAYRTSEDQDTIDATKANVGDSYTKTESDAKYVQSLDGYATESAMNTAINTAVSNLIDGAPEALDTLKELADAVDGVATQTWVEGKGYLTEHQDLSAYRTSADQDAIDINFITTTDSVIATYQAPETGIPKTDLASAVQASLDNADSALQDAPSDGKQYARKNGAWAEVVSIGGGSSSDEDNIEIVTITDASLTLADINETLNTINTEGRHVMFDTSALGESMYLCTIYIDSYSNPTVFRIEDKVTGKLNVGTYDGTLTLLSIMQNAVEDFVTLIVSCVTQDNVTVTGQTVTVRQGDSASSPVYTTAIYSGQPLSFVVPKNFAYYVSVTDNLSMHFSPTVASGIASTNTNVTLTYSDLSNIASYSALQTALTQGSGTDQIAGNVEISDTWTDESGTEWDDPAICVAVREVEDEDGNTHLGAIMMRKWAMKNSIQFDAPENEEATEVTATEGLYYIGKNGSTLTKLSLSTGDTIPYSDYEVIYHNDINFDTNMVNYGYNNYKLSGIRQYLTSEDTTGNWWEASHIGDKAPSQASTTQGYLAGCSQEMKDAVKAVKIQCYANNVTDNSRIDTMYDKVWLPSGTEIFGSINDNEGTAFPVVSSATGLATPSNSANAGRIYYSVANHSSSQYCWLRSADRGSSGNAWIVYPSGKLDNNYYAYHSYSAVPAFVIY